ncbi:MAG: sigma-70 family RNA polymerase sigma factor [Acidobacteria bacterium]|nr:sigma-70 family RNA polymerase sigma factor [Acidobacteriota bacterium]
MQKSDAELVAESLQGNSQAFEEIVRRHQKRVFSIVYHYLGGRNEVEDLAQEVFIRVFRSLDRFDSGRSLGAWVSRIAANRCLDELRKPHRRRLKRFADLSQEEEGQVRKAFEQYSLGKPIEEGEAERLEGILRKVLSGLKEKDRLAFVLREIEGLGYEEVAAALATSPLGARLRVSRARKKIREAYEAVLEGRRV